MSRSAHLQHRRKVHHPERYVGAHPFNPPQLIPLVELTKGDRTSNDALDRALAFYRAMGKDPIVLQSGFVANRISHGETCFSPPKLFILDEKRDFIKIRLFSRIFPKSLDSIYILWDVQFALAWRGSYIFYAEDGRNARVTQVEKGLMWELYQKRGSFKEVAEIVGRSSDTVSRYVREHEAAVNAVRVVVDAKNI